MGKSISVAPHQSPRNRRSHSFPILTRLVFVAVTFGAVHTVNNLLFSEKEKLIEHAAQILDWELIAKQTKNNPQKKGEASSLLQIDQDGFIGSPRSKLIRFGDKKCDCDLVSIDCLESISCISDNVLPQIHSGIMMRQALKESLSKVWDSPLADTYGWAPLGKTLQSLSIKVWREFLQHNQLPKGMYGHAEEEFVNATSYPYCIKHSLKGKPCFFDAFGAPEEYGALERDAIESSRISPETILANAKQEWQRLRNDPATVTPYAYLLGFCHLSKITLNLRQHMMDIYARRVKTIEATVGSVDDGKNTLRVALHVRRGDACCHQLTNYQTKASPLGQKAQTGGLRHCYETAVYVQALERVQRLSKKHLVVHVATDHMVSLLDEIKKHHPTVFNSMTWKYVDYPRTMFNYSTTLVPGSDFIEWAPNKAFLGETAIVDIYHLSFGQVFVGHLGSRFGKLSWWQATARHNAFVPFYTVDGHSVCCDIDEACGDIAPAIVSMENCLTFSRDDNAKYRNDGVLYWKIGATVRFQVAADEVSGSNATDAIRQKERDLHAAATTDKDYQKIPSQLTVFLKELDRKREVIK